MAFNFVLKTVTVPKCGLLGKSRHLVWDVSASFWAELHETGGLAYIHLRNILWVYCPGHAGVTGNDRADR